jgi:PAS domain S-box-containing protein
MPKPAKGTGRSRAAVRRRVRKPAGAKASRQKKLLPRERPPELELIYDTAPVGLAFLSPDCRYVHINQRLTEICGIPVADHIGRSVRQTVPQVAEQVEQVVQAVLRSGEPITGVEVRGQRADGLNADHVWITDWHPLKSPDGKIVGVNVVAEDITERTRTKAMLAASEKALRDSEVRFRELKQAENESREARRELAQVARRTTLAAMTAAIAHEMKQPLGAIVTNANAGLRWLGRSPPDLTEIRDALTHIAADGHRASDVIQSVRAVFAKGDQAGTLLDANELIRETIDILRPELDAAKITIHLCLASKLPSLLGHKVQLQQVVLNIVTNAADAMRTVADRPKVLTVKSALNDWGGVAVAIEDSGTGVDPENVDRVFDPFFTTKAHGMGLGLAICRSIVEAHGGSLSLSSGSPHGSVFHVFLPGSQ